MDADVTGDDLAALLRRVIDRLRQQQDEVFAAVDAAVVAGQPTTVTGDPVLVQAIRTTIRSNILAWTEAVYRAPFAAVAPNDGLEPVAVAAEFRQRGLTDESVAAFRDGQAAAWDRWVELGSAEISDPHQLKAFLTHSARSIFAYIDATTAAITDRLDRKPTSIDASDRRRDHVMRILDGQPVAIADEEATLHYRLDQNHLAVVLWTQNLDGAHSQLDAAATDLVRVLQARPVLRTPVGTATQWLWVGGDPSPSLEEVTAAVQKLPAVCLAVGVPAQGIDGFRSSHADAQAAQRVISSWSSRRIGSWAELELVALLLKDPVAAQRFTKRTLGEFLHADADLRETVRVYLQLGANATQTSKAMYTHRNTIIDRVRRAEGMLPGSLADHRLHIACALELAEWLERDL